MNTPVNKKRKTDGERVTLTAEWKTQLTKLFLKLEGVEVTRPNFLEALESTGITIGDSTMRKYIKSVTKNGTATPGKKSPGRPRKLSEQ